MIGQLFTLWGVRFRGPLQLRSADADLVRPAQRLFAPSAGPSYIGRCVFELGRTSFPLCEPLCVRDRADVPRTFCNAFRSAARRWRTRIGRRRERAGVGRAARAFARRYPGKRCKLPLTSPFRARSEACVRSRALCAPE